MIFFLFKLLKKREKLFIFKVSGELIIYEHPLCVFVGGTWEA